MHSSKYWTNPFFIQKWIVQTTALKKDIRIQNGIKIYNIGFNVNYKKM